MKKSITFAVLLLILSSVVGSNFSLGSTLENVYFVMGSPTKIHVREYSNEVEWDYAYSSVTFKNGKVYEYSNISNNLKVILGYPCTGDSYFSLGSNFSEVYSAMGTPKSVTIREYCNEVEWDYAYSSITFKQGKVSECSNISGNLKTDSTLIKARKTSPKKRQQSSGNITAENGSYYGERSSITGRSKTVYVNGYFRKDGTYVRGHYRSNGN